MYNNFYLFLSVVLSLLHAFGHYTILAGITKLEFYRVLFAFITNSVTSNRLPKVEITQHLM